MTALAFIIGLSLGIGFFFWKQRQYRLQLQPIINILFADTERLSSMSVTSIVRQGLVRFNQKYQELEQQLQIWQKTLEKAPIGYLILDEENQLLWCNEQARQLLKLDRWQPGKIRFLLELVRSYELDRLVRETRQTQQNQVSEWVFYPSNYNSSETNSPTKGSVALKGYSLPLDSGRVAVFLENRQSLIELSRSRDRAFSDLAHELRTPLTSISLVSETIQKRVGDRESKLLARVLGEIDRLMHLIQDWLEITQVQENPLQNLNYDSLDLRESIFSIWQTLEPIAQQKQVDLVYTGPQLFHLEADRARLTQVFLNLFDNALKHSPPGSKIKVEVREIAKNITELKTVDSPKYVQIDVIDSGPGFAPSDLPHIFERLYRGDTSRTRQTSSSAPNSPSIYPLTSGSGLGLALVREVIKAHRGSIEAQNHPETGGAWLKIVLPIENYAL